MLEVQGLESMPPGGRRAAGGGVDSRGSFFSRWQQLIVSCSLQSMQFVLRLPSSAQVFNYEYRKLEPWRFPLIVSPPLTLPTGQLWVPVRKPEMHLKA